ncbi:hypothetical protein AB0P17_06500 [Streptomyces sp. NPDC088124]|uniref:hypothetical protein n=1 Tax=Streptomyces sp. NPDC088124 TaxID=3154654 RepID=UPI00342FC143
MTVAPVVTIVAGLVLVGCGSGDGDPADPKASAASSGTGAGSDTGAGEAAPIPETPAGGTLTDRAAGSWKSIVDATSDDALETLTVADGKVTAKGPKLDCTGTLDTAGKGGADAPSLTLSCADGTDGGRGAGTVKMKGEDALAIDWAGPEGGFGGPVDSFRRS